MFRKYLVSILVVLLMISLMGCGIKNAFFKKKMPPLEFNKVRDEIQTRVIELIDSLRE